MKNKLLKITSFVLAIAFALSMVVYAEESDVITAAEKTDVSVESDAYSTPVLTIDKNLKVKAGEMVDVYFELVSGDTPVKSFALSMLDFDKDAFRLVKGEVNDVADAAIAAWDYEKHNMVAAFKEPKVLSTKKILKISFKAKADAKAGEYCISCDFQLNGEKISVEQGSINVEENPDAVIDPVDANDYVVDRSNRKSDTLFMVIGESASFVNGKKILIDPANKQVVPYIKNERTLVPLRFVSESIGAEVLWEDGWDYCLIKKDGKEIKITFGSAEFEVNGEKFTYEAPIETVHDRTMVPVRFISEHLGYNVYWQELNQAVVITPESNPWIEGRNAEEMALVEVIVSIKGILP